MKLDTDILRHLPLIAVVYAGYQYYSDRGIEGIMADLQAIAANPMALKTKVVQLATGVGAFIVGGIIAKQTPNKYVKVAIKSVAYYTGASQIFSALRSGAAGSSRSGYSPAMMIGQRRR